MTAVVDLKRLGERCALIAQRAADENGFVSVRNLLSLFNAKLRVRPLLVEGMLATLEDQDIDGEKPRWLVLIDSERYPVSKERIAIESATNPLPARFRFTVAHELCHTLAFAQEDHGIALNVQNDEAFSRENLVHEIEKETDRLTTLLLCPEPALQERLIALRAPISVVDISRISSEFGLSREAFVNRLLASKSSNSAGLWQRPQLRDFGILIAEGLDSGEQVIRGWPILQNFSEGIIPEAFHRLRSERSLPLTQAFPNKKVDPVLTAVSWCILSRAGTTASPDAQTMEIQIELERPASKRGARTFILIRNMVAYERVREFERLRMERLENKGAGAGIPVESGGGRVSRADESAESRHSSQ